MAERLTRQLIEKILKQDLSDIERIAKEYDIPKIWVYAILHCDLIGVNVVDIMKAIQSELLEIEDTLPAREKGNQVQGIVSDFLINKDEQR